jgi:hypothetical protein
MPAMTWRTGALGVFTSAVLLAGGCASSTRDGLRVEIYWDAAVECESRYRTLHLDHVDMDGNVTMHADAESRHELQAFTDCYRKGVQARIERRRQAGLEVPDTLNREPTAEID